MVEALTIAIDFDDTFTADVELWTAFIAMAQGRGHRVVCVSAREERIENRRELTAALPFSVDIFLSNETPKKQFVEALGVYPDIWIDDIPEGIAMEW